MNPSDSLDDDTTPRPCAGGLHQRWVLIANDGAVGAPPLDLAAGAAFSGAALH